MTISKPQAKIVREIAASSAKVFGIVVSPQGMVAWAPKCQSASGQHPQGASVQICLSTTCAPASYQRLLYERGVVRIDRVS